MKKNGFTMIELVIVITIIGLLSSILMPNFSRIQDSAKKNTVKQVVHTLQMALESYYLESGSYPTSISSIDELLTTLQTSGDLSSPPTNPYTGQPFASSDDSGKIDISIDTEADSYHLTGYDRNNATVIIQAGSY